MVEVVMVVNNDIKNELRDNGWSEGKQPSVTQPSFLRTDLVDY